MEEQERTLLVIVSHLLSYPQDSYMNERSDLMDLIIENIDSEVIIEELHQVFDLLNRLSLQEMRETYVSTFDLKSKLGLYLTAHELGDSRKRGAALIKLQKMINQAGFERMDGELADYMPMLFEFLAVSPENSHHERLQRRLAVAVQRMLNNIPDGNPYTPILTILMRYVFPAPTDEEIEKLEFEREEADLEELPYPIMYE
ncbi:nitrate reductase molybdenum cofactor assembly chaperone [Virgibacillus alimentarius]|uniref:Nitrate reductase delta subunit n=1 Tax=Virgibacillus alimentarius TaxID=698769 RepID=A0ABS4SBY8_9BACI|nr:MULTISPECIES: nitrate reductase molybdenum cofactor assembly chaperone [Virgibacillus]MBP2258530.1 nitrate reductase delta subunit [Virgibacillus alimentarius]HLR67474.1 nitrate reductase molybdenum cofactor assembly chaperone [Virgibacillus sp.]